MHPRPDALYFTSIPRKICPYIEGLEDDEPDTIIEEMQIHGAAAAEYRHKWHKGDVVIWDNRCSYHKAAGDYPPEEDRIHWRVSINEFVVSH